VHDPVAAGDPVGFDHAGAFEVERTILEVGGEMHAVTQEDGNHIEVGLSVAQRVGRTVVPAKPSTGMVILITTLPIAASSQCAVCR